MGAAEKQSGPGSYDETLEDSFPASDPPPGVIALGPPKPRHPGPATRKPPRKDDPLERGQRQQRGPARPSSN